MLLTGGGTGGHITPLLAVAAKLKAHHPNIHITYVGERGSKFASMTDGQTVFDSERQIFAGKFRRYHGESWLRRLLDIKTNLLNLRDLLFVGLGCIESVFMLMKIKPDIILLKGGFVGMPVGLAAALLRIPFITHDSDAVPGLANRAVARWARYHATGMPASFYKYPSDSVRYVGVLVGETYSHVSETDRKRFRQELSIPVDADVLMITGGSNGAEVINKAVRQMLLGLKAAVPKLYVIHQTGQKKEYQLDGVDDWLLVRPLLKHMYQYSGAADVIITRAGANTMAEFGVQGKACIVVPNPLLTGGHQLVNARELAKRDAVVVVDEASLEADLQPAVRRLFDDEDKRRQLADSLHSMTRPHAADELAQLLLEEAGKRT